MNGSMKKGFYFILYLTLVGFAVILTELNPSVLGLKWVEVLKLEGFFEILIGYRLLLIVACTLLLVLLPNPQAILSNEKFYSEIRLSILEQIRDEVFEGDLNDKRITILSKSGRRKAIWLHTKRFFRWILMKLGVDKLSSVNLKWGTFLIVKQRLSNEDDSYNSKASFFCHHVNENLCDGVAAVVTRSNRTKDISNLPDVEEIDIKNVYLEGGESQSYSFVETYMRRTYIKDVRTLLKIKRKAKHFFGMAICGKKGTPVGALLIDSMEDNFILSEEQKYQLSIYSALLGKTYK